MGIVQEHSTAAYLQASDLCGNLNCSICVKSKPLTSETAGSMTYI